MKHILKYSLLVGLLAFVHSSNLFAADSTKVAVPLDTVIHAVKGTFVVETRHRIHVSFQQIDTVQFGQSFDLGEGDFVAKVIGFNPDFAISLSGKKFQASDTLNNPAILVQVTAQDSTHNTQEIWAFYYGNAPHFRRESMFGFKLIDFKITEPIFVAPPSENSEATPPPSKEKESGKQ